MHDFESDMNTLINGLDSLVRLALNGLLYMFFAFHCSCVSIYFNSISFITFKKIDVLVCMVPYAIYVILVLFFSSFHLV